MSEKITSENFTPMTDEKIKQLWIEGGWRGRGESLEHFTREIRDEEMAVVKLLELGFDVVEKGTEDV